MVKQLVEKVPPIKKGSTPPPPLLTVKVSSRPLGLLGFLPGLIAATSVSQSAKARVMLRYAEVNPIKHFQIVKHYLLFVLTGISGKLRVEMANRTPFKANCTFYNRSYSEGFKLVETTINFSIPRRSAVRIDYNWSVGFLDLLVRAFLSLFSSETCCKGYINISGLQKNYDVTKTIKVE